MSHTFQQQQQQQRESLSRKVGGATLDQMYPLDVQKLAQRKAPKSSLDVDAVARFALRSLRFAVGADVATVYCWHAGFNRLLPRWSTDNPRWARCGIECRDAAVVECFFGGAPINLANVRYWCRNQHFDFPEIDDRAEYFSKTTVCVPLLLAEPTTARGKQKKGRASLGVLQLTNRLEAKILVSAINQAGLVRDESFAKKKIRSFSSQDTMLAHAVAAELAVLIQVNPHCGDSSIWHSDDESLSAATTRTFSSSSRVKKKTKKMDENYDKAIVCILRRSWDPSFAKQSEAARLDAEDLRAYRLEVLHHRLAILAGITRALVAFHRALPKRAPHALWRYLPVMSVEQPVGSVEPVASVVTPVTSVEVDLVLGENMTRQRPAVVVDRERQRRVVGDIHAFASKRKKSAPWYEAYATTGGDARVQGSMVSIAPLAGYRRCLQVRAVQPDAIEFVAPMITSSFHSAPALKGASTISAPSDTSSAWSLEERNTPRIFSPALPSSSPRSDLNRRSRHRSLISPHSRDDNHHLNDDNKEVLGLAHSAVIFPSFVALDKPASGAWKSRISRSANHTDHKHWVFDIPTAASVLNDTRVTSSSYA